MVSTEVCHLCTPPRPRWRRVGFAGGKDGNMRIYDTTHHAHPAKEGRWLVFSRHHLISLRQGRAPHLRRYFGPVRISFLALAFLAAGTIWPIGKQTSMQARRGKQTTKQNKHFFSLLLYAILHSLAQ